MPQIIKQSMKPVVRKVGRSSILDDVCDISDIPRCPWKILLYGPNRAGKTYLACTFPKPLLLVSFEPMASGGAESVRDFEGVKYRRLDSTKDAIRMAEEIPDSPYKTLVVDSATSLQDVVLKEILGLESMPVQLSWGTVSGDQYRARAEKTKEVLRRLLDCPLDVIIIAKERDHNSPKKTEDGKIDMRPKMVKPLTIESFIAADVGGATAGWLHDCCDYIFRLYKDEEIVEKKMTVNKKEVTTHHTTGRYVRHLLVDYHPNYAGGCRLGAGRVKVPESGILVNPTYASIMELIG